MQVALFENAMQGMLHGQPYPQGHAPPQLSWWSHTAWYMQGYLMRALAIQSFPAHSPSSSFCCSVARLSSPSIWLMNATSATCETSER